MYDDYKKRQKDFSLTKQANTRLGSFEPRVQNAIQLLEGELNKTNQSAEEFFKFLDMNKSGTVDRAEFT